MGDMADIMARGEAWLSTIGWEAVPAFPVAAEADLRYTHPAPGDFTFVDSYCIPTEAPNLDTAYAFINHMLSPEAQAIAMDDMDSATVNEKAIPLLERGDAVDSSPTTIWTRSSRSRRSGASHRSRIRATAS